LRQKRKKSPSKILDEIFGSPRLSGEERLYFCPKCNHHNKNFSVNVQKSLWKCWVCSFKGVGLRNLLLATNNSNRINELPLEKYDNNIISLESVREMLSTTEDDPTSLPEEYEPILIDGHKKARKYLEGRGITTEDIIKYKLGVCYSGRYAGRIIFPSFDSEGNLNYFVARTYHEDNDYKYLAPRSRPNIVFNGIFVDWSKPVWLVEGAFDHLFVPNSIPLLGSSIKKDSMILEKAIKNNTTVILALDGDVRAGKVFKIAKFLSSHSIEVYIAQNNTEKDINELYLSGELPDILKNVKKYSIEQSILEKIREIS